MFLSIPGAWKFSHGVHYPINSLPKRWSAFSFLLNISWQQPPSLFPPPHSKYGMWKTHGGRKELIQGPWHRRRNTGLRDDRALSYQSSPFRTRKQKTREGDNFLMILFSFWQLGWQDCKTGAGFFQCLWAAEWVPSVTCLSSLLFEIRASCLTASS